MSTHPRPTIGRDRTGQLKAPAARSEISSRAGRWRPCRGRLVSTHPRGSLRPPMALHRT